MIKQQNYILVPAKMCMLLLTWLHLYFLQKFLFRSLIKCPLYFIITVNVLKFRTLIACQKGLDKQGRPRSDCVWSGSSLFATLTWNLWIPALKTNILFMNRKRKVFEILEHLPYRWSKVELIFCRFLFFFFCTTNFHGFYFLCISE